MVDEVKVCSTSLLQRERPEFIFNLGAWSTTAGRCQHLYVMLPMIGNGPEIQRRKKWRSLIFNGLLLVAVVVSERLGR
jgi:hypothetical protein